MANLITIKTKTTEPAESNDTSLLVVILDTNPSQKLLKENPRMLTKCLESVISFGNSHLMQKSQNKLAIIACHSFTSKFVYPDFENPLDYRQSDGQYEVFTLVEKTVKHNIGRLLANEAPSTNVESLLAGTIAMALCYIARLQRNKPPGCKMNSRVLVITGSNDSASQYMNYMNVFFTAQKQNVVIDVCSMYQHLSLLQQGCDITGGLFLKIPQIQGLLQYLLWVFLPEPPVRQKLILPPAQKVDYRAACFCHREMIDIGFVCSVCLSIFCKFSPICTTCHTVFKTPGPLSVKSKKKKIKL